MSAEANPYEAVDIDAFTVRPVGIIDGLTIMQIVLTGHPPFEACVFRDNLVRFLFQITRDEWHLGNDGRFIQFPVDDLYLALSKRDADRFDSYGWVR